MAHPTSHWYAPSAAVGCEAPGHDVALRLSAQLLLGYRRNQIEINRAPDVPGVEPVPVEELAVEGNRLVGVTQQPAEPGILEFPELSGRGTRHSAQSRARCGPAGA